MLKKTKKAKKDILIEEQFEKFFKKLKTDVANKYIAIEFEALDGEELAKAKIETQNAVNETLNYKIIVYILTKTLINTVNDLKEKK